MNPYSTELAHHGILGQRWGKKNGPPYPLDAEDHSASEKKAGWKKSLESKTKNIKYAVSVHKLSTDRNKTIAKRAGKVAGAIAAVSLIQTGRNWASANQLVEGMVHIPFSTAAKMGLVKAGKVAAVSALATAGAHKLYDSQMKKYEEAIKKQGQLIEKSKNQKYVKGSNPEAESKYTLGFLNYMEKATGGLDKIDDAELIDLCIMEYESTGRKARK